MTFSDQVVREIEDAVANYFGTGAERLKRSAAKLWRDDYPLEDILNILGGAFRAGYDTGYTEGAWDAQG